MLHAVILDLRLCTLRAARKQKGGENHQGGNGGNAHSYPHNNGSINKTINLYLPLRLGLDNLPFFNYLF